MGELHLEIYCERLKREEGIAVTTSKPYVKFREVWGSKVTAGAPAETWVSPPGSGHPVVNWFPSRITEPDSRFCRRNMASFCAVSNLAALMVSHPFALGEFPLRCAVGFLVREAGLQFYTRGVVAMGSWALFLMHPIFWLN